MTLRRTPQKKAVPARARKPVILNFDRLPPKPWRLVTGAQAGTTTTVAHGILTINTAVRLRRVPARLSERYLAQSTSATRRGWVIEASLKIDPSPSRPATARRRYGPMITPTWSSWGSTRGALPGIPDLVLVQMDTTDAFHIYRIESKGTGAPVRRRPAQDRPHVEPAAAGAATYSPSGTSGGGPPNLTQWDYFSYDVFPRVF